MVTVGAEILLDPPTGAVVFMPACVVFPTPAYAAGWPPGGGSAEKGRTRGFGFDDHGHVVTFFKYANTVELVPPCRVGVPESDPERNPGHVEGPGGGLQDNQNPLRGVPEQWPQLIPAHFLNPWGSGKSSDRSALVAATRGPASSRIRAVAACGRTSADIAVAFVAPGTPSALVAVVSGCSRPVPGPT